MIDSRIQDAINDQLNFELYSAYIYYSMQSWFENQGMGGFANWMAVQVKEEMSHAQIMFDYVNERGGRVYLKGIEGPNNDWESPLHIFQTALEHEQIVTGRINDIMELAQEIKDHATVQWIQWFIAEQVEEEDSTYKIVQQLKLIGDDRAGLYLLDRELAKRVPEQNPAPVGP